MKLKILSVLLLLTVLSPVATATTDDWLAVMRGQQGMLPTASELEDSQLWYDCGLEEEGLEFCADQINYYKTEVSGRFYIFGESANQLRIEAPFSSYTYNELILNLRKDGFILEKVSVDGLELDVKRELAERSAEEVNREVVILLNKGSLEGKKELMWSLNQHTLSEEKTITATFLSHQSRVSILFKRSD